MKVWFKRILLGLLLVVLVALLGFAAFVLTFNPNEYKYKLEEFVLEQYQRTLSIEGDVELSLFPRIGLSVSNVSLSNRDSTDIFAAFESARFAVAIWPLLTNHLVVDHVAVEGLRAWVYRGADGAFNFDDLLQAGTPDSVPLVLDPAVRLPAPASTNTETTVAGEAGNQGVVSKDPVLRSATERPENHVSPVSDSPTETALQIDIAGLELKDSEIHYVDEQNDRRISLVEFQLATGRMTFNQAFDVSFKGRIQGDSPVAKADIEGQAQLKIDSRLKQYAAHKVLVRSSGIFEMLDARSAVFKGNFAYDNLTSLLDASAIEVSLKGAMKGDEPVDDLEMSLSLPRFKVDSRTAELQLEKLTLRAQGSRSGDDFNLAVEAPLWVISPQLAKAEPVSATLKVAGNQVLGLALRANGLSGNSHKLSLKELKLEGRYKSSDHLVQFDASSPLVWNLSESSGGLTALKGDVSIENPTLPEGVFEFPLIGSIQAALQQRKVSADLNAVLNGAPLNFKLTARAPQPGTQQPDQPSAKPYVSFNLQADALDFNEIFPVVDQLDSASGSTKSGADKEEAEQSASARREIPDAGTDKAAPAPESASDKTSDLAILKAVDVDGQIQIGAVSWRQFSAGNVHSGLKISGGKLSLSKLSAEVYDGRLTADAFLDADWHSGSKVSLTGVSVGPLLRAVTGSERISGRGALTIDMQSRGSSLPHLKRNLQGDLRLQVQDGAVRGIDLEETVGRIAGILEAITKGESPLLSHESDLKDKTEFSTLDAQLVFASGVGQFKKLAVNTPIFQVRQGKPAAIDLDQNQIDLVAQVTVVGIPDSRHSSVLTMLRNVPVPLRVTGDLDKPDFTLQWEAVKGSLLQAALRAGVGKQLEKLGLPVGGSQNSSGRSSETSKGSSSDAVRDLGKSLKGLLKR